MRAAWALAIAFVLSGCAAENSPSEPLGEESGTDPLTTLLAPESPIRFASGDYEAIYNDEATFAVTDGCFFDCNGNAVQAFDLTPYMPADAPVELSITIQGDGSIFAYMESVDADSVYYDQDDDGQVTTISALMVRSPSGTVTLHVAARLFQFPPSETRVATIEVRSVVRAGVLVPYMPAAIELAAGDSINFTGLDVDGVVLLAPDGTLVRDETAPFTVSANGTSGTYFAIVQGDGPAQVFGPNTTMLAKRITYVETEPYDLSSGQANFDFTPEGRPLWVGFGIQSQENPAAGDWSAAAFVSSYDVTITAPGGQAVVEASDNCGSPCDFTVIGYMYEGYSSNYIDESLVPGTYSVAITAQGAGIEAIAWYSYIA